MRSNVEPKVEKEERRGDSEGMNEEKISMKKVGSKGEQEVRLQSLFFLSIWISLSLSLST